MITTIVETKKTQAVLDYVEYVLLKNNKYIGTFADAYMKAKIYDNKVRLYMFVDYKNIYIRPVWLAVLTVLSVVFLISWDSIWSLAALPFLAFEFFLTSYAFYFGFISGLRKRGIKEKVKLLDVGKCLKEELI